MARLAQVIKKLNIGLSTAVEFLNKKGEQLENNPNTRLTDEQESLLVKEFSTAETIKMEADRQTHLRQEQEKEKLAEERKEKAEYAKKVGQLTMQVDWLKKKSEEICGPDYESKFSPKPFDD